MQHVTAVFVALGLLVGTAAAWERLEWTVSRPLPAVTTRYADANAATDGEMHFLRDLFVRALPQNNLWKPPSQGGPSMVARQLGTILVSDTVPVPNPIAVGGGAGVGNVDTEPPLAPLTHAHMAAWALLNPVQRNWLFTNANTIGLMQVGVHAVAVVDARLTGCHASIVSALAATALAPVAPANLETDALATLAAIDPLGTDGGGRCDIAAVDFTMLQGLAVAIHNIVNPGNAADWTALSTLYPRFHTQMQALHAGVAYDVWVLRGWLYATDRRATAGHRVLGAFGAALKASIDSGDPRLVHLNKMRYAAHDGTPRGQPGTADDYGLGADTVGHIRPRALGGYPEPLNIVPQSWPGQKLVNIAESLLFALVDTCGVGGAGGGIVNYHYGVVFHYANLALRRPDHTSTWIDADGNCNLVRAGTPYAFNAGTPIANAVWLNQMTF